MEAERGTGGWPQFDWMLNGGSLEVFSVEAAYSHLASLDRSKRVIILSRAINEY